METDWTTHWQKFYGSFRWKLWIKLMTRAYKRLLRDIDLSDTSILELGSGSGNNLLFIAKLTQAKELTFSHSALLFRGLNI